MGNMQNIAHATQEQIKEIVEEAYVPENAAIAVIGNIDYETVLSIIEDKFSDWKDKKRRIRKEIVESMPGIYFNKGNGQSSVISVGFQGPAYCSASRPLVDIAVRILGMSNMDSRMMKEIRVKRGLSYNLGGFSSFYGKRGTVGFMAVCDKEKSLEVAKVIIEVLNTAKIKGFLEEEIEREKRIMETSLLLSVENITEHLRNIGKCSVMESNFFVENEVRYIRNIQKEDVERELKMWLKESNVGLAVIGDCNIDKLSNAIVVG